MTLMVLSYDIGEIDNEAFEWDAPTKEQGLNIAKLSNALYTQTSLKGIIPLIIDVVRKRWDQLKNDGINYKAIRRWTRSRVLNKIGFANVNHIFEMDKILFPIHENGNHWCIGSILI